jgi:hypothetical protein
MKAKLEVLISAVLTFFFMSGCSGFSALDTGTGTQSLGASDNLVADVSVPQVGQSVNYSAPKVALAKNVTYRWTQSLTDVQGSPLSPCAVLSTSTSAIYQLRCSTAGLLTVNLTAVADGTVEGPFSMTQQIVVASTPGLPPTPSPLPVPNPAGVSLFSTNCQSCHGSVSSHDIRNKSVSSISSAIQSVGSMRGISLTAAQIQQISDALNGK